MIIQTQVLAVKERSSCRGVTVVACRLWMNLEIPGGSNIIHIQSEFHYTHVEQDKMYQAVSLYICNDFFSDSFIQYFQQRFSVKYAVSSLRNLFWRSMFDRNFAKPGEYKLLPTSPWGDVSVSVVRQPPGGHASLVVVEVRQKMAISGHPSSRG